MQLRRFAPLSSGEDIAHGVAATLVWLAAEAAPPLAATALAALSLMGGAQTTLSKYLLLLEVLAPMLTMIAKALRCVLLALHACIATSLQPKHWNPIACSRLYPVVANCSAVPWILSRIANYV